MSTLVENVNKVVAANAAIKDALAAKGVDVTDYAKLSQAAEKINSISADGVGALPADKDTETGEYTVSAPVTLKDATLTAPTLTEPTITAPTVSAEDGDTSEVGEGLAIDAYDDGETRGLEVYDGKSGKSTRVPADGSDVVTINSAAWQALLARVAALEG